MKKEIIQAEFIEKIEQKVADLEKICSLEFVAVFAKRSSWLSYILPKKKQLTAVELAAHRQFMKHQVDLTELRQGVLIYVSLYEKSVYLLADRGVTPHVPPKEWADLGATLAKDFNQENPGETFLSALELLAKRVAPQFPPIEGDRDELSNRVRIED
jgi:uncharacterized membrane protein